MHGKLLDQQQLTALEGDNFWLGGAPSGCAGATLRLERRR